MSILKADKIHKAYNKGNKALKVLRGIDLDIEKGKISAIVGPSGAGKSTLLHILGGLDNPTQGEVFFENKSLYKLSDSERAKIRNKRVGFVFQFYHLLSEFTAIENVYLPAVIGGDKAKNLKKRSQELLKQLGLANREEHYPSQLSGGEMQRVAIARALINNPEVLFCDEPTGNLDSAAGLQIKQLIWGLNQSKEQTVVIVTHDETLFKDADRVLHIKDGLIN